jgi:uridine kinase
VLDSGQPILLEGIHGLNDALTDVIPMKNKLKLYVSALTQMNIMDHLRVATSDVRLLRRMIRDYQFRGYSIIETLERWPMVRKGEEFHIFPYQEEADIIFNSSLTYEMAVLRGLVLPLLISVPPEHPVFSEAKRLMELVMYFLPLPAKFVPSNSILREFIGESSFSY